MITLFVTGLEFYGYHGVSDEEQKVGHRYVIDLEMGVVSDAEQSDQVEDTVDYGAAAVIALKIGTQRQFRTLERLAQVIGEALMARFSRLREVSVRVAKRLPPAPLVAEEAGVELVVKRSKSK